MANRFIVLFVSLLTSCENLLAAACCGGGSGLPNIITGDYKAQFSLSYANSAVVGAASDEGEYIQRNDDNKEVKEIMTLKGAYLLSDYIQFGLELPFIQNTYETNDLDESYQSLGDPTLQIAYEFLPELTFSPWKPRGFVFISHTHSTTDSIYESESKLGTDSLGTGFDTTYIGLTFSKIKKHFDFAAYIKQGFRNKKSFSNRFVNTTVTPGQISTYGIGLGYAPKGGNLRFGTIINSYYEKSKKIETPNSASISSSKSYTDFGINTSYQYNSISYGISYIDQSFWDKFSNTNLNKTFSFSVTSYIDL